jgi:hypothetical protein
MVKDQRDVLEVLKSELNFLEQGGYERSVGVPWKWTSTFRHSPSCINFKDPDRTLPCRECPLIDFVPSTARSEDVPCHHIPIGPQGETVTEMEREHDLPELEDALKNWLQASIHRLEQQQAGAPPTQARPT